MKRWRPPASWALSILVAAGCGCGGSGPGDRLCDAESLQAALDAAAPGDTVLMGACRIDGSLRVPAGVTLSGVGDQSVIAPTGSTGVWLEPGDPASSVESLKVEASAVAGIGSTPGPGGCSSRRAGTVAVTDVTVDTRTGWGVYLSCIETAELTRVTIRGPINTANYVSGAFTEVVGEAPPATATCDGTPSGTCTVGDTREMVPDDCTSCGTVQQVCDPCERWATITAREGLALRDVGATLSEVDVSGFVVIGVTAVGSTVMWDQGASHGHLGVGLHATDSMVHLTGVEISDSLASPWRVDLSVGAYARGGALMTDDVEVHDNDGFGILQVDSTGSHAGLTVENNQGVGLWAGNAARFDLTGGTLTGNSFAGVALSGCSDVTISDTTVSDTAVMTSSVLSGTETGRVDAGDGLHLRDTLDRVVLRGLVLDGNHRVGLLLDMGPMGAGGDLTIEDVTVRGTGMEMGAIAGQRGGTSLTPIPPGTGGWDSGITREGAPVTNDPAMTDIMDIVGVVAPTDLPKPEEAAGVVAPTD